MRSVRLRVQHGNGMPGDVVGYPDELAERLLARGLAEPAQRAQPAVAAAVVAAPPAAAVMVAPTAGRGRARRP